MTDDAPERPHYEDFTETKDYLKDQAPRIIKFLEEQKGTEDVKIDIRVVTVLGAGWQNVWEDVLTRAAKEAGLDLNIDISSFDNNKEQIKLFGNHNTQYLNLGTEDGNAQLADILEDSDILYLSNVGDKIEDINFQHFVDSMVDEMPPVVVFSGGRRETSFAILQEGLESAGYTVNEMQTGDPKRKEVSYQAIAFLQEE